MLNENSWPGIHHRPGGPDGLNADDGVPSARVDWRESARHYHPSAGSVFFGLTPTVSAAPGTTGAFSAMTAHHTRSRNAYATGSVLLAGSLAAMALNATLPVSPAAAGQPQDPAGAPSESLLYHSTAPSGSAADGPTRVNASQIMSAGSTTVPALYRVEAGDTVSDIAVRHGLSTASVLALNGLSWSSTIFPGQQLALAGSRVSDGMSSGTIEVSAGQPAHDAGSLTLAESSTYTVQHGDTVSAIAERFSVSTLSMLAANLLGWSSLIYPGQVLLIPGRLGPQAIDGPGNAPSPIDGSDDPENEPSNGIRTPDGDPAGHVVAPSPSEAPTAPPVLPVQQAAPAAEALVEAPATVPPATVPPATVPPATVPPPAPVSTVGPTTPLDDEMRQNASTIARVGRELGVPDYGIVIALATAMQESSLRNISWGDLDSVGLFQQRPSSGWGTNEQLTDPDHAAHLFYGGPTNPNRGYTRGLLDIRGWESMALTDAAQRVQISGHPDAYAKWESSAWAWLGEVG